MKILTVTEVHLTRGSHVSENRKQSTRNGHNTKATTTQKQHTPDENSHRDKTKTNTWKPRFVHSQVTDVSELFFFEVLLGVLLRVFTPRTAIITRFPRTWFAGLRNDCKLRTLSGSTLNTGQEPTDSKKLPTDWQHGSFFPRHLTLVPSAREKG